MSIPFTWIYLIYDPYTQLFKIGKTDDPHARLKQLQSNGSTIPAAPSDYVLLEAWIAQADKEAALHRMFEDYRIRGEWFDLGSRFDIARESDTFCWDVLHQYSAFIPRHRRLFGTDSWNEERQSLRIIELEDQVRRMEGQLNRASLYGYMPPLLNAAPDEVLEEAIIL